MVFLGVYYTSLDFGGVGADGYTLTFYVESLMVTEQRKQPHGVSDQ